MPTRPTTKTLTDHFEATAFRLVQERNDFLLPQILDFVKKKKWINLRPEYQRRLVWDVKKRSLFLESLLLNVPIPQLFLYESELGRYEVMDGQQRLNAVVDFYENRYPISGLTIWEDLNGMYYQDLPETLKRGLSRRRLSATVLLLESNSESHLQEHDIRKLVFERLNTGGQELNAQELRNCLYAGPFNELLIELAQLKLFCEIWEIPPYEENVDRAGKVSAQLAENRLYRRMLDCEIVLRFFALETKSKIKGSVRTILDRCMETYAPIGESEALQMAQRFTETLTLAHELFGEHTFRYKDAKGKWRLSLPLYDAVMTALSNLLDHRAQLVRRKRSIARGVNDLLSDPSSDSYSVIVGRPNTATAIVSRIDMVRQAITAGASL